MGPTQSDPLSCISLDHSHDILHESEAAPWLACTPITRNLPLARKPVHPTTVNDGAARRPSVDGRPARDFSFARKGRDELWDEGILLVPEAETAVACRTPDEDESVTRVSVGPRRARCGREGTRWITHPFESTARLCCGPAEIWRIFRSFRPFTRANRERVGRMTSASSGATYSAYLQSRIWFFHS